MTSSATPTDDDRDEPAPGSDGQPPRVVAEPATRSLIRFGPIPIAVGIAAVVADFAAHGFEPPPPIEAGLVVGIAGLLGTALAFVVRDWQQQRTSKRPFTWSAHLPRLIASAAILIGWAFIGWHERFRITPPSVFLCIGWLAVVEAVLYLWRAGFAATGEADEDALWWRPIGERDELEREKKSLLKAIKEIEFDREMGKTSDADAGEIVRMYRTRAIEVIKALDALEPAEAGGGGVKDEIERELRARIAVAAAGKKRKAKKSERPEDAT
jgi:hypothetical protein